MGCGVRPPQGLGIKAVVYEFLVLKISDPLFLQGDDNTYSTILPRSRYKGVKVSKGLEKTLMQLLLCIRSKKSRNSNKKCERELGLNANF